MVTEYPLSHLFETIIELFINTFLHFIEQRKYIWGNVDERDRGLTNCVPTIFNYHTIFIFTSRKYLTATCTTNVSKITPYDKTWMITLTYDHSTGGSVAPPNTRPHRSAACCLKPVSYDNLWRLHIITIYNNIQRFITIANCLLT